MTDSHRDAPVFHECRNCLGWFHGRIYPKLIYTSKKNAWRRKVVHKESFPASEISKVVFVKTESNHMDDRNRPSYRISQMGCPIRTI